MNVTLKIVDGDVKFFNDDGEELEINPDYRPAPLRREREVQIRPFVKVIPCPLIKDMSCAEQRCQLWIDKENGCGAIEKPRPHLPCPAPAECRKWFNEYKGHVSCYECGENSIIEFHHMDPFTKVATITDLVYYGSIPRVLMELEKCVPLCANCHRRRHREARKR